MILSKVNRAFLDHLTIGSIFLFICLISPGCKDKTKGPDVSGIELRSHFHPLSSQIFALKKNNGREEFQKLLDQYPIVLPFYLDYYLDFFLLDEITHEDKFQLEKQGVDANTLEMDHFVFGPDKDTLSIFFDKFYHLYVDWPAMKELYSDCNNIIDEKKMQEEMNLGLRYFKHYFPKDSLPTEFYGFVAPFRKQNAFRLAEHAGVELDMYLGADYKYYQGLDDLRDKRYVLERFDQVYLVRDFIENLLRSKIAKVEDETLYLQMIQEGKNYFGLKQLFPNAHDSVIYQYPNYQVEWIEKNVGEVYAMLWDQDVLFKLMTFKTRKYVEDGPYTNTIHPDCPSRVGAYIGSKILENFQSKTGWSLERILAEENLKMIFDKANYKPARN